jgi:hypothetical protein
MKRLISVLVAACIVLAILPLALILFDGESPHDHEDALAHTQDMLATIEANNGTLIPVVDLFTPSPENTFLMDCWPIVQQFMMQNDNQYVVQILSVAGDGYQTPTWTGSSEIIVEIAFPDKSQILVQYYNGAFRGCTIGDLGN